MNGQKIWEQTTNDRLVVDFFLESLKTQTEKIERNMTF